MVCHSAFRPHPTLGEPERHGKGADPCLQRTEDHDRFVAHERKGFWDITKLSTAPLVASHSNVHALCQHSRSLTDRQLDAIRDTGGLVGINFGVLFLRHDGIKNPNTGLDSLVRHVAYIADRIGIDHVALGSDFDGTTVPADIKDVAGLQRLVDELRVSGFDEAAMSKITHQN